MGLNKACAVLGTCIQTSMHRKLRVIAIFGTALREKTLEIIMGRRQQNCLNESVGLARFFSRMQLAQPMATDKL